MDLLGTLMDGALHLLMGETVAGLALFAALMIYRRARRR